MVNTEARSITGREERVLQVSAISRDDDRGCREIEMIDGVVCGGG